MQNLDQLIKELKRRLDPNFGIQNKKGSLMGLLILVSEKFKESELLMTKIPTASGLKSPLNWPLSKGLAF
jgi:hypothetical protein